MRLRALLGHSLVAFTLAQDGALLLEDDTAHEAPAAAAFSPRPSTSPSAAPHTVASKVAGVRIAATSGGGDGLGESHEQVLMTQRSQVQILPPQPNEERRASARFFVWSPRVGGRAGGNRAATLQSRRRREAADVLDTQCSPRQ